MDKIGGKVITVFSSKGGVGKTTLVLNLAGIYAEMKKKVLVIDFDLCSGGIALSLNVDAKKDIYNLADDINNNRYKDIVDYITIYNKNIDILACPRDPRSAVKIDPKYVALILSRVVDNYDVVLVDTSHILDPISLSALDKADKTLLVLSNDPVDLKNTKSLISIFKDIEKDDYVIVLNSSKDTGKDYFSMFEMKNAIKNPINYEISKSFYIPDIDKYVMAGEILTLNPKIRFSNRKDINTYNKMAEDLIKDEKVKKGDEVNGEEKLN